MAQFPEVTEGSCAGTRGSISLGLPTWYKYLDCRWVGQGAGRHRQVQIDSIGDFWGIIVAGIEIVLFVAGVSAVFIMAYGGIQFMMSQGQPDRLQKARDTLIFASVGLIIAIMARVIVQFIYNGFVNGTGFL